MIYLTPEIIDIFLAKQKDNQFSIDSKPIQKKFIHKEHSEQAVISSIKEISSSFLSGSEEKDFNRIFYATAIPNLKCPVVFDHRQDHYPFMLLCEIARQMAIGISHEHYDTPFENFCNTLSEMAFDIKTFIELDFPLTMVCVDKILINKATIQRRALKFFYIQNGQLCASANSSISVMTKPLYKRFRLNSRNQIAKMSTPRYEEIPSNLDMLNKMILSSSIPLVNGEKVIENLKQAVAHKVQVK